MFPLCSVPPSPSTVRYLAGVLRRGGGWGPWTLRMVGPMPLLPTLSSVNPSRWGGFLPIPGVINHLYDCSKRAAAEGRRQS